MNAVTAPTQENQSVGPQTDPTRRRRTVQPDADIIVTKEGVELRIDVPGVAENDIEIQLEKNILTIRARREVPSTENHRPWITETGYCDYECAFRLGFQADPEKIVARCKYGVLTVTAPRAESDQPKRIEVKTG